jgi:hypothetical protein
MWPDVIWDADFTTAAALVMENLAGGFSETS